MSDCDDGCLLNKEVVILNNCGLLQPRSRRCVTDGFIKFGTEDVNLVALI